MRLARKSVYLLSLSAACAAALLLFAIVRPREPVMPDDFAGKLRWLESHPSDYVAASAVTEGALDARRASAMSRAAGRTAGGARVAAARCARGGLVRGEAGGGGGGGGGAGGGGLSGRGGRAGVCDSIRLRPGS